MGVVERLLPPQSECTRVNPSRAPVTALVSMTTRTTADDKINQTGIRIFQPACLLRSKPVPPSRPRHTARRFPRGHAQIACQKRSHRLVVLRLPPAVVCSELDRPDRQKAMSGGRGSAEGGFESGRGYGSAPAPIEPALSFDGCTRQ